MWGWNKNVTQAGCWKMLDYLPGTSWLQKQHWRWKQLFCHLRWEGPFNVFFWCKWTWRLMGDSSTTFSNWNCCPVCPFNTWISREPLHNSLQNIGFLASLLCTHTVINGLKALELAHRFLINLCWRHGNAKPLLPHGCGLDSPSGLGNM